MSICLVRLGAQPYFNYHRGKTCRLSSSHSRNAVETVPEFSFVKLVLSRVLAAIEESLWMTEKNSAPTLYNRALSVPFRHQTAGSKQCDI
jgi:hypothetical protein